MIKKGLEEGLSSGYEAESQGFSDLGMTSESKALRSIFFGQVLVLLNKIIIAMIIMYNRMNAKRIVLVSPQEKLTILLYWELV